MNDFFYFVDNLVRDKPLVSVPLVFISGVLVSLTPCFYPLIPVILGIVGIDKESSKKRAFFLSTVYVLGLAFIYTLLGIVASITGTIFGTITKNFLLQFAASIIFLFMGLMLLDILHLPIHFSLPTLSKKSGFIGAFILGIISGLVVGGCTFPVLGSILALMAFSKNILLGGFLLFIFSLGIGVVFIGVSFFGASLLEFIKKNPKFSLLIKKLFGVIIIIIALYFLARGISLL